MAKDSLPSIHSLDKPEKLEELLKQDRGDDCLPCKIVGEYFVDQVGSPCETSS